MFAGRDVRVPATRSSSSGCGGGSLAPDCSCWFWSAVLCGRMCGRVVVCCLLLDDRDSGDIKGSEEKRNQHFLQPSAELKPRM